MDCIYIYRSKQSDSKCCKGERKDKRNPLDESDPSTEHRQEFCIGNFRDCPRYLEILADKGCEKIVDTKKVWASKELKNVQVDCIHLSDFICKGGNYDYEPESDQSDPPVELYTICKGNFRDCPRYIAILENAGIHERIEIVKVEASEERPNCRYYYSNSICRGGKGNYYDYKPHTRDERKAYCIGNFTNCPRYIAFSEFKGDKRIEIEE
jgi:hypothetical protein